MPLPAVEYHDIFVVTHPSEGKPDGETIHAFMWRGRDVDGQARALDAAKEFGHRPVCAFAVRITDPARLGEI